MAVTQNTYTGNGSTVLYSFTFPYLETTDIEVSLNGVPTTAYTLANATTIQFNTAPANGVIIKISRATNIDNLAATFFSGSAIRAGDLNTNATQALYAVQEVYGYVDDVAASGIGDGNKGDVTVSLNGTFFTVTSANNNFSVGGTGFVDLPAGTTAQRPASPNSGMVRYNTSLGYFEGYGTSWGKIGGGATGGGSDDVFFENGQTVTTDYTITTNKNAVTAGPITINNGITVTVPSGSSWSIV